MDDGGGRDPRVQTARDGEARTAREGTRSGWKPRVLDDGGVRDPRVRTAETRSVRGLEGTQSGLEGTRSVRDGGPGGGAKRTHAADGAVARVLRENARAEEKRSGKLESELGMIPCRETPHTLIRGGDLHYIA